MALGVIGVFRERGCSSKHGDGVLPGVRGFDATGLRWPRSASSSSAGSIDAGVGNRARRSSRAFFFEKRATPLRLAQDTESLSEVRHVFASDARQVSGTSGMLAVFRRELGESAIVYPRQDFDPIADGSQSFDLTATGHAQPTRNFFAPLGLQVIRDPSDQHEDRFRIFVACAGRFVDSQSFAQNYDNDDRLTRGVIEILYDPTGTTPKAQIVRVFEMPRSSPTGSPGFWPFDLVVPNDVAVEIFGDLATLAISTQTPEGGTFMTQLLHFRISEWPDFFDPTDPVAGQYDVVQPEPRGLWMLDDEDVGIWVPVSQNQYNQMTPEERQAVRFFSPNIIDYQGRQMMGVDFVPDRAPDEPQRVWTSGLMVSQAILRRLDPTESPVVANFQSLFGDHPHMVLRLAAFDARSCFYLTVNPLDPRESWIARVRDDTTISGSWDPDHPGAPATLVMSAPGPAGVETAYTGGAPLVVAPILTADAPVELTDALDDFVPQAITPIARSPFGEGAGVAVTASSVTAALQRIYFVQPDRPQPLNWVEVTGLQSPYAVTTF